MPQVSRICCSIPVGIQSSSVVLLAYTVYPLILFFPYIKFDSVVPADVVTVEMPRHLRSCLGCFAIGSFSDAFLLDCCFLLYRDVHDVVHSRSFRGKLWRREE